MTSTSAFCVMERRFSTAFAASTPAFRSGESRIRLAHLKFLHEDVFKRVGVLSGGERMRAGLACILLLLDEPTNHPDLEAIASIEAALRAYEGALLVVSHDPDFVRNVGSDRAVELG
ncbi:MAG: transporter [Myxococcaceae bacterium]|nr:transporter [Myxococcaceae bacterium]